MPNNSPDAPRKACQVLHKACKNPRNSKTRRKPRANPAKSYRNTTTCQEREIHRAGKNRAETLNKQMETHMHVYWWVAVKTLVPLGPLNIRCRFILRNQTGTLILTTTHQYWTLSCHKKGAPWPLVASSVAPPSPGGYISQCISSEGSIFQGSPKRSATKGVQKTRLNGYYKVRAPLVADHI